MKYLAIQKAKTVLKLAKDEKSGLFSLLHQVGSVSLSLLVTAEIASFVKLLHWHKEEARLVFANDSEFDRLMCETAKVFQGFAPNLWPFETHFADFAECREAFAEFDKLLKDLV